MGNQIDENYIRNKVTSCIDPHIAGFAQTGFKEGTDYCVKIKKVCKEKSITLEHIERFSKYSGKRGNVMKKVAELIFS